jgi:hypothetical protein
VYRSETVATSIATVLVLALIIGIAYNLWSLTAVLSLFPYFIILAIATVMAWGFRFRVVGWIPAHEQERKANSSDATMKVAPGSTRPSLKSSVLPSSSGQSKAKWRPRAAAVGLLGVTMKAEAREPRVELLHTGRVKVAAGVHQDLPFLLSSGDKVEGTATDFYGRDFDWYFLDDQNYAAYYADRMPIPIAKGSHAPSAHVNALIPHSGTWHLVLDGRGKRSSRSIDVRLTRTSTR